jgi:hypothetical protein
MTYQQRIIMVAAGAALAGFAVGALWQYSSARRHAGDLHRTEHVLAFTQMEATLGAATIEAQRGSYEISRQLASEFFTQLQANAGRAEQGRRSELIEILQQRDAMITALSRSDPQSGALLAQLFTRLRIAMGQPVGPTDGTASPPVQATPDPTGGG